MTKGTISLEQVRDWIQTMGSTPSEVSDPESEWHLELDYPAKSTERMHVVQPKGRPYHIVIASGMVVAPNHVKAFDELPADEQESFSLGLRRVITRPEVDFQVEGGRGPYECPTAIQISRNKYADGLTLDSFAEAVGFVFKARLQAIYHIQEYLNGSDRGTSGKFDFRRAGM